MTDHVKVPEDDVASEACLDERAATDAHNGHDAHGEAIPTPFPTVGPLIVGLGATVLILGIMWLPLLPVGAIVTLVGIGVMTHRSKAQLAVDHHTEWEMRQVLPNVDLAKLGMWVFLASEVMFFAALISTFIHFKTQPEFSQVVTEHGVRNPMEILSLPLVTVNTFLLLASSFAAASALAALRQGRQGAFRGLLMTTLVLGAIFLTIQGIEWSELFREGINAETLFGTGFFTTTGFHGLHVFVGLVALLFILARAFRGAYTSKNPMGIELFGLYWHFVDVVWIVLFTLIYLI